MTLKSITLLLVLGFIRSSLCHTSSVKDYVDIINNGIENILKYELPVDASMHRACEDNILDAGEHDFIIIGGGTTGSVIASRLSEREDFKVLLIEAGHFSDNGIIQFPKYSILSLRSDYNWGYRSIPQTTACLGVDEQKCNIPRGKGVGGTTLINGLISSRGDPINYDNWAKILNDSSWSYENVLKYFKKSENFHWVNREVPVDMRYHGTKGLLHFQHKVPNIFLNDLFFEANKELGINAVDNNSDQQLGTSIFQIYTQNGTRQDMGSVFIKPFLERSNLKVVTESYVTKIEINNQTKIAESVLYTNGGTTYRVKARKEIILSAGTIASPQILMLSGVGPKQHLEEHNISLIQDLEVGSNLRDHALLNSLLFSTDIRPSTETIEELVKDYIQGIGNLTAAFTTQSIGFYETQNRVKKGVPNIAMFFDIVEHSTLDKNISPLEMWKTSVTEALWANNTVGISFNMLNIGSESRGTIRLKSSDPFDYPLINPHLLSDPRNEDIDDFCEGIKLVFKLTKTKAFQKIHLKYMSNPLPACRQLEFKSKEYWHCFIKQVTTTAYHHICTCPMGVRSNKEAVVDSDLKVFGVDRLRVADASVFPTQSSSHPSVTCIMIGEKISDVIKKKYSK